jgi:hypothetical protein
MSDLFVVIDEFSFLRADLLSTLPQMSTPPPPKEPQRITTLY